MLHRVQGLRTIRALCFLGCGVLFFFFGGGVGVHVSIGILTPPQRAPTSLAAKVQEIESRSKHLRGLSHD